MSGADHLSSLSEPANGRSSRYLARVHRRGFSRPRSLVPDNRRASAPANRRAQDPRARRTIATGAKPTGCGAGRANGGNAFGAAPAR
jgi:hypothetical protein